MLRDSPRAQVRKETAMRKVAKTMKPRKDDVSQLDWLTSFWS